MNRWTFDEKVLLVSLQISGNIEIWKVFLKNNKQQTRLQNTGHKHYSSLCKYQFTGEFVCEIL